MRWCVVRSGGILVINMTLSNILKYTIYTGLFAALFIPLYVSGSLFFPFITGKNFIFRILIEILAVLWVVLAVIEPAYRPKKTGILIALATFLGIITVADFLGENPAKSIWSNFERMEGLVTHVHLFAYFLIASSVLLKEKLWTRFFQTSLGVNVIVGCYGLLQLAGKLTINQGGARLDATFGNASYLAVYNLFHIFIAAFLMMRAGTSPALRYVYGAIILLNSFILYHTATRGAILGFIAGALLCTLLIAIFEKENKKVRKISIGIIASILIVVGLFMSVKDSVFVKESPVLNRFATISLEERTTQSRFIIWGMAMQGAKENPILGSGQENFNLIFNKYYDPRLYANEPFFDRAHNVFLDWLTAAGLFGLLSYLGIFAAILFFIWRNKVNAFSVIEKSILTGLLGAYFFHNLFVFDNLISYILFFSIAAFVSVRTAQTSDPVLSDTEDNSTMRYATISLVIILFIPVMYFVNIKPILANRALLQGIAPQEKGIEENLRQFKKALSYNTFADQEIREQLMQISGKVRGFNIPAELKEEFFVLAREEMIKQTEDAPNDARHYLFLGSFLGTFGLHDEAIIHLEKALALSPNKQLQK